MLKPAKVTIKVGKILKLDDLYAMPPSKEIYNAITEKIMFAIAQLSNEKYSPKWKKTDHTVKILTQIDMLGYNEMRLCYIVL